MPGRMPLLFASLVVAPLLAAAQGAASPCVSLKGERSQVGPQPLTSQLIAVSAPLLRADGDFHQETFRYMGVLKVFGGAYWHIASLVTTWGEPCRTTDRLLMFDDKLRFFGQYSNIGATRPRIEGTSIVFDGVRAEAGNRIQFTPVGPPAEVRVAGEIRELHGMKDK